MKEIPLTGTKAAGRVALVDDGDYELVSGHRWRVYERQRPSGTIDGPYARTHWHRGTLHTSIFMHTLITGVPMTDHRNGDGLDNQRLNLRPATHAQNNHNQRPVLGHSSKYKGVTWHRQCSKWQVCITTTDGKRRYLGIFTSEEDAARVYDEAALKAFGEYAYLNFGAAR
jgi:hypothetical protein